MDRSKFFAASSLIAVLSIPTIANAALVGRLAATEGGTDYQAYYDTEADLTWLADANYAMTSGYDSNGRMNWSEANAWATSLNIAGITSWRLPNTNPIDGTTDDDAVGITYDGSEDNGYNVSAPGTLYEGSMASEMAYLYHNTLGNLSSKNMYSGLNDGWGLVNIGPFINIQTFDGSLNRYYWSATDFAPDTNSAWIFNFNNGFQGDLGKGHYLNAWAVHDGDVSAVPVPGAVWLFGSGLIGLIGFVKRKAS